MSAAFNQWVANTIEDLLSSVESTSATATNITGIYILSKDGVCVYVGQSRNVAKRIAMHKVMNIVVFYKQEVIECQECDLTKMENMFINELSPILNKRRTAIQQ